MSVYSQHIIKPQILLMELEKTVERIVPKNFKSREEYLLYLRHVFVYEVLESFLKPTDRVLEIGFGEGYGTKMISRFADTVIGLDVNEKAVNYAAKRYGSDHCSFKHFEGDRIPFQNEAFDAAVSYQVIEHIDSDKQYLQEIARVLKNGGKLFLTTPNRRHRLEPEQDPWNPYHIREYSVSQLGSLLQEILSKVEMKGVNAREDIRKIEVDRVKRGLTLKKLVPNFMQRYVYGDFIEKYDTSCFYLDENAPQGLDLFAICTK